jgi:CubicO group peptidase (beta-lactamase class C family)
LSDQSRAFPDRPNLRYLKIEAKRRLAAGEFGTLHDTQLAIAREHGLPSWTALKESVEAAAPGELSHALTHVRWVAARFRDAADPAWVAPGDDELREHFDDHYLSLVPADTMIRTLGTVAARLREDLVVSRATPDRIRAQIADLRVEAGAEPDPPYRLTALRLYPVGDRVTDARTAEPPTVASGAVPELASEVAAESFAELGLVGLVLAGAGAGPGETEGGFGPLWTTARGWADLDRPEALRADHRFPAYGVTKLVTSTAVLRLVAEGRVSLDGPANEHLRTLRLADDGVTVRELLTHTGGVSSPTVQFADGVPDPVALLGPTVACDNRRGTVVPGNGGYAVLGQLIADVTASAYPDATAALVLEPLGMTASWFPSTWPGTDAVTGYRLADDGRFERAPAQVSTMPAAGGLWTTAGDLVRFGLGWTSLLSGELGREALRPQAAQPSAGAAVGLGWLVNGAKDVHGHAGAGPGAATSLIIRPGAGITTVACTNRMVPIEPVNARLVRPIA